MSLITNTVRGDECSICYQEFKQGESKYTHIGGENHDGYHKQCLKDWLKRNPICPHDQMPIDPSGLLSNAEKFISRFKPAVNAGLAALLTPLFFGWVAGTGLAMGKVAETLELDEVDVTTMSIVSILSSVLGVAFKGIAPFDEEGWKISADVIGYAAAVAGTNLEKGISKISCLFSGTAGGFGMGAVGANLTKRLLSRLGIDDDSQAKIGHAIGMGLFSGTALGFLSGSGYVFMGAASLFSGVAAAAITPLRWG